MSFINDLLSNIPRDIDYPFGKTMLIIFVIIIAVQIIVCSIVYIMAVKRTKKAETKTPGIKAFTYALLGIAIYPIGGVFSYLYRLLINPAKAVFFGNTNIFIVAGIGIYAISFTVYIREVVNLSKAAVRMFKFVFYSGIVITTTVSIPVTINIVYPLDQTLINTAFMFAAAVLTLILIFAIVFAIIDYFRISNKLTKVRLGMSIISAIGIIIQLSSIALYYYLVLAEGSPVQAIIPHTIIIVYSLCMVTSLALYYGFFIPIKIQEWTGILPPSFKLLKEKQKLVAKKDKTSKT